MKTKHLLLFLLGAVILAACSKEEGPAAAGNGYGDAMLQVPFTATFKGANVNPGSKSNLEPRGQFIPVKEDAYFSSAFMGDGTFTADFQFDILEIKDARGTFESLNGDKLYVKWQGLTCEGGGKEIYDGNDAEDEICCWHTSFQIVGGTGKYANAHGGGVTRDYYGSDGHLYHHQWTGTILLQIRDE